MPPTIGCEAMPSEAESEEGIAARNRTKTNAGSRPRREWNVRERRSAGAGNDGTARIVLSHIRGSVSRPVRCYTEARNRTFVPSMISAYLSNPDAHQYDQSMAARSQNASEAIDVVIC